MIAVTTTLSPYVIFPLLDAVQNVVAILCKLRMNVRVVSSSYCAVYLMVIQLIIKWVRKIEILDVQ